MVKRIAALVIILLTLGACADAAPTFKLEPGKPYYFVFDCFPQVGCYAEIALVVAVDSKANRVLVHTGEWINLAKVSSTKEYVAPKEEDKPAASDKSLRVQDNGRDERSDSGTPVPVASR